ncbi:hypothetical protein KEM48_003827 [Puccinia striiformis f. sp. tritici PST-130]|nr:hypothetical protein H4Q26_003745 [Puccinia striiformis f. sp. tritici PST-130]KAI9613277.1 hypothetical protein KEM48_003827 [Puccinia striiformis f. sp. tritici PST-130]
MSFNFFSQAEFVRSGLSQTPANWIHWDDNSYLCTNALSSHLFTEINELLSSINSSSSPVRCLVITGSEKAFAAGADIPEMADRSSAEAHDSDFLKFWSEKISSFRVPIVAAVSRYALGRGCELAMMWVIA